MSTNDLAHMGDCAVLVLSIVLILAYLAGLVQ
jgi:hypothetical protein